MEDKEGASDKSPQISTPKFLPSRGAIPSVNTFLTVEVPTAPSNPGKEPGTKMSD